MCKRMAGLRRCGAAAARRHEAALLTSFVRPKSPKTAKMSEGERAGTGVMVKTALLAAGEATR